MKDYDKQVEKILVENSLAIDYWAILKLFFDKVRYGNFLNIS